MGWMSVRQKEAVQISDFNIQHTRQYNTFQFIPTVKNELVDEWDMECMNEFNK